MIEIGNVLSLFDGCSGARLALDYANIKFKNYYASEIDKYAMQVANDNFPLNINVGNVVHLRKLLEIKPDLLGKIDLLIGGSPCQNFSFAGNRTGMISEDGDVVVEITTLDQYLEMEKEGFKFKGESYLFWEYVAILKLVKPKFFFLENVKMVEKWSSLITKTLGVNYIEINSALVTAQTRKRFYWTNIKGIKQPDDLGILLKHIILDGAVDREKSHTITGSIERTTHREYFLKKQGQIVFGGYGKDIPDYVNIDKLKLSKKEELYMRSFNGDRTRIDKYASYINNDKSRCLLASFSKGVPYNTIVYCGQMVGRKILNGKRADDTDVKAVQRIEARDDGKTNCITTVQKDNLIVQIEKLEVDLEGYKTTGLTEISPNKPNRVGYFNSAGQADRVYSIEGKSICLGANGGGKGAKTGLYIMQRGRGNNKGGIYEQKSPTVTKNAWQENNYWVNKDLIKIRKLHPIECERLQSYPDDYSKSVSFTQRYKMMGNSFTPAIIAHMLSFIPNGTKEIIRTEQQTLNF